ncbi:restriction endonuclease subunit S, partial [Desulfobacterales bacterium HSG17]|nr:restriction endonuclease subunit S [Desulfobacterales bacterium HSG17]
KNSVVYEHLIVLAGTTTIPDLNHGDFLSVSFLVPPKSEQEIIISFLNDYILNINTIIERIYKSIFCLKEYRTALISAAVTGKIDVRNHDFHDYMIGMIMYQRRLNHACS